MGRANGQALPGQIWSDPPGIDHRGHVSHRVADVGDAVRVLTGREFLGQADQPRWIRFVRCIAHRNQRWIDQSEPFLEHEARRGRLRSTDEAPAPALAAELGEKIWIHEQGLITDQSFPLAGITVGITTKVKITKHRDQSVSIWWFSPTPPQEFEAGIPVVVPEAFTFQRVDLLRGWPPSAVVRHRLLERHAIAAGHITDDSVDVEQKNGR